MTDSASSALNVTYFFTKPVEGLFAVTDAGRSIPLVTYEALAFLPAGLQVTFQSDQARQEFLNAKEQEFLANTKLDPSTRTKLVEPSPLYNCHGWFFTGGRFGIAGAQVSQVLADNGYELVSDPRDGDIAIFSDQGILAHSGIVRLDPSGATLVDSKWGPFGVYRHALDAHPYPKVPSFYRSPRRGHLLTIAASAATEIFSRQPT